MKLIIDNHEYVVEDELIIEQIEKLFQQVQKFYVDLPPIIRLAVQAFVRDKASIMLDGQPKGSDPIIYIISRMPNLAVEAVNDATATFTTSKLHNTPTIKSIDIQLQSESQGGGQLDNSRA